MPYGTIKVDTITFTAGGADTSVSISGLVQNPTFTGNITTTGTVTAATVVGTTTVSGATVTGTQAQFTVITGGTAGFTTITGTTVTGTTANFATVSGTTVTGTTGNFGGTVTAATVVGTTTVSGATVTGNAGSFTTVTGGVATITSGVFALGTAALPSISFSSDPNTGIYSPGADQVAISTNGTGRLFVDSSGNVGVGQSGGARGGSGTRFLSKLASGQSFIEVQANGTADVNALIFSDGSTGNYGAYGYDHSNDSAYIQTAGNTRVTILSDGKVGLGTSSPGGLLHCALATTASPSGGWTSGTAVFGAGGSSGSAFGIAHDTTNGTRLYSIEPGVAWRPIEMLCNGLIFKSTNNSEAARFDTVGRLLVGTSTARTAFQSPAGNVTPVHQFEFNSQTYNGLSITHNAGATTYPAVLAFGKSRGSSAGSYTAVASGDGLGWLDFYGADGTSMVRAATISAEVDGTPGTNDMPGRLVFSTTADGAATPTERLRITSAGLVGVGTSSPSYTLDVSGTARITSVSPLWLGTTTGDSYIQYGANATTANNWTVGSQADGTFRFFNGTYASGTERLRITSAGNVGIGTTSPSALLDVVGSSNTLSLSSTSTDATTKEAKITCRHYTNSEENAMLVYGASTSTDNAVILGGGSSAQNSATYIQFITAANNTTTSGTERARIDSSGRLLVGTSSARSNFFNGSVSAALQVEGTGNDTSSLSIVRNSNDTGRAIFTLAKTRGGSVGSTTVVQNNDVIGSVEFQGSDGTEFVQAAAIECQVDGTPGANDMPGRLVFSTTADGASSPTERMRIRQDGSVLMAVTTTNQPGFNNTTVGFAYDAPDNALFLSRNNTCLFVNSNIDSSVISIRRSGSEVGSISVTTTATAYNTSSDYRLKENIVPLTGAADRLNQLQVHRFNFIANPDKTVDGFIAHEAQAVVPECVTGTKDAVDDDGNPVYQGIDQSKLVPLLTAALQEALAEIESLKARVTALEP